MSNGLIGVTDCYSTGDPASRFFAFERDPFVVDTLVADSVVTTDITLDGGILSTTTDGTVLILNGEPVTGTFPEDIVANSVTAGLIATTQGVNNTSVQLTDGGIGLFENEFQYFSIDNDVPGGNTLRIFTNGTTPGVAMTVTDAGNIDMFKDVAVGGQLEASTAAILGTIQANTASVNNITAAIDVINVSAPGGVNVTSDLTVAAGSSLIVEDIAKTGSDARISINPGISDDVITTSQFLVPTNIGPGGTVSYVLNNSTDQPCNWFSGLFAVSATLTVGGANIPFNQAMFSYSPNNVANIFQQFQIGLTLSVGSDSFGSPVLTWTNTSGDPYNTPLNVRVLKVC